jgi:hypothetical protein
MGCGLINFSNGTGADAEQPSLEQRDHAMNSRQHVLGVPLMALDLAVIDIPVQPHVGGPAVGPDRACRRNGLSDEPMEGRLGQVRDADPDPDGQIPEPASSANP